MFSHVRVRGSPRFCDCGADPVHNSSLATECKRSNKQQRALGTQQSQLMQEMYARKYECINHILQQSQRTMQKNQNTTIAALAREQCNRIRTKQSQLLLENNATKSEHNNHSSC
jgi:hypothetical protein